MSLVPFLNRHAGETAWLFGKGPSLSHFDFKTAGPLRAAINDVSAHIPECIYCFANDGVQPWADLYREGQTLFQPERAIGYFDSQSSPDVTCSVVVYKDDWEDDLMDQTREKLAECLAVRRGTLGSAIQVLHVMGVSKIIAVGIDGGNTHATGHKWRTRLRLDHSKEYDAIRDNAIRTAERLGIDLQFYQPTKPMSNGKIKVVMLRTCSADGKDLVAGQSYELAPATAHSLCMIRRAMKVDDDGPSRETASAKPALETATLKPATSKKIAKRRK